MPIQPGQPAAGVTAGSVLAGKYRVEQVLGSGGMGVVVAAMHLELDERVAVKFLFPHALRSREAVARFAREARAAVKIKGEHVARTIDVGKLESGAPYMVMEYLQGSDLSARLRALGPLPIEQAVEFVLHACEAIAEAHGLGIIHRDLKPANLFITTRPDGSESVKVLDFGISKVTKPAGAAPTVAVTATSAVMGSPLYLSPEQTVSARNADVRSDIWALGVTLYEALTATPPFQANSIPDLCQKIRSEPAPPLRNLRPDAPEKLQQVILRCLQKQPEDRYQNVAELAVALAEFAPRRAHLSVERALRLTRSAASASELGLSPSSTSYDSEIESAAGSTQGSWGHTRPPGGRRRLGLVVGAVAVTGVVAVAATWTLASRLLSGIDSSPTPAASPSTGTPSVMKVEPDDEARAAAAAAPSAASSISATDKLGSRQPSPATKPSKVPPHALPRSPTGQPPAGRKDSPQPTATDLFSDRH